MGYGLPACSSAAVYVSGILEGDWRLLPVGDQVLSRYKQFNSSAETRWNRTLHPIIQASTTSMKSRRKSFTDRCEKCTASHCGPPQSAGKERRTQDRPLNLSFSILYDDFLTSWRSAYAAISSECFYEECDFFLRCSYGKKKSRAADFQFWFYLTAKVASA